MPRRLALLLALASAALALEPRSAREATPAQLESARAYVRAGWRTLVRSHRDLARAAEDPKFPAATGRWPVYVPAGEDLEGIRRQLARTLTAADRARIELRVLPRDPSSIRAHGLLWLPHPYVVPGGRFNEMYGWDSFFIVLGLLRDGEVELARQMTENQLYQVERYGKVLNANRTYYLSRSHPPLLSGMVLRVFARTGDRAWLGRAWPALERLYGFWTRPPRHVEATGLARYWDDGDGPAPEVLSGEVDAEGKTHYDRVRAYFRAHAALSDYDVALYYDRARDHLTDRFFRADRAMRESGFDPSARFGPFNAAILDHNPVCLNSLLYQLERDAARICELLGRAAEAGRWRLRAALRGARVNRLMWDEAQGLYLDHDHVHGRRRAYPFATTFFPLWVGLASGRQAARVAARLAVLERPGGLSTSASRSGTQWDEPFGWAPLNHVAVEGLRRYGFRDDADRIAVNFLSLVLKEFLEHGSMFEKYDVVRRESGVAGGLRFGYTTNEIGFGWTNAAFTDLLPDLGPRSDLVRRLDGVR